MPPTILQALRLGARAAARSAWLAPIALVVALARAALVLPAQAFAFVVLQLAAAASFGRGLIPGAALEGVLAVASSPRFIAIVAGLWAAGVLLAGALRVAYLAGALPTLGWALAGGSAPAFASGFVRGFAHLLPAAALGLALEVAAGSAALAAAIGAALVGRGSAVHPVASAAIAAASITAALVAAFAATAIADATVTRSALRGERPMRALARAAQRFARRPAAFLSVGLAVATVELIVVGSIQSAATVATGASAAHPLVALGPQLMAGAAALLVAALLELWRLGSTAVLACHRQAFAAGAAPER